jgi:hypothetical protein
VPNAVEAITLLIACPLYVCLTIIGAFRAIAAMDEASR